MFPVFMNSAKMATVGFLEVNIYVQNVTNKILSHDSNYIIDVVI